MEEDEAPIRPVKGSQVQIDYEKLDADIQNLLSIGRQEGGLNGAIDGLLNLEKQMRLAADVVGTRKVALAILGVCHEAKQWALLNDQIVLLSKRRSQLKQVVTAVVQEAMGFVDALPEEQKDVKVALMKTLSTVTAGKMYVEIERARLVKKLAKMKEDEGNVKESAELMQEVAVETFGAMAKTEKIAFILEQVRLCLDHEDYMRAQILAKKINPRVFSAEAGGSEKTKRSEREKQEDQLSASAAPDVPSLPELKRKFYELMIRYYKSSADYLEICRCYQSIYESSEVQADASLWSPVLKKICWYVVLSPHDPMQRSLLHSTSSDKKLNDLPVFKGLVKEFTNMEVIQWRLFSSALAAEIADAEDIFGGPKGAAALKDLQLRVIQHNILVVSKFYSRITLSRLGQLLDLPNEEAEKQLAEMAVAKSIAVRIDRPAGIISFSGGDFADNNSVLNAWSGNIGKLLELVETSCHEIHKEAMLHKLSLKA